MTSEGLTPPRPGMLYRGALGSCVAGLLALVSVATAGQGGGAPPDEARPEGAPRDSTAQDPPPPRVEDYASLDKLPEDIRTLLSANTVLSEYLAANEGITFRVINSAAPSTFRRLAIRKDGDEVGYAIIRDGKIRMGGIDGKRIVPQPGADRPPGERERPGDADRPPPSDEPRPAEARRDPPRVRPPAVRPDRRGRGGRPTTQPAQAATSPAPASQPDRGVIAPALEPVVREQTTASQSPPAQSPPRDEAAVREAIRKALETTRGDEPSREGQTPPTPTVQAPAPRRDGRSASGRAGNTLQQPEAVPPRGRDVAPRSAAALPPRPEEAAPPAQWSWLPETDGPALMWVAVIFILATSLRTNQPLAVRNLDGLVLAGTCVLLALRSSPAGEASLDVLRWSYLLLSAAALYWMVRGVLLVRARSALFHGTNIAGGGMLVMLLFALAVAGTRIINAPLSAASRDGLVGGHYLATTGRLPYGHAAGVDERSPLLYGLHAAAGKLLPPTVHLADGNRGVPDWDSREAWMQGRWWETVDDRAARAVNVLLLALTLIPLYLAGRGLHSAAMGLTLVTIFCVFPGTVECLNRPDVMLAAALLAWAVACAALQRFGGALSALLLTLAGLAWPWAWLGLPVLLGYHLRRGWEGLGTAVGLVGGTAAVLGGLWWLTAPTIARADGALAAAGRTRTFSARWTGGAVALDRREPGSPSADADLIDRQKQAVWAFLLDDSCFLGDSPLAVSLPAGQRNQVGFHDLAATPDAAAEIQAAYATVVARPELPLSARMRAALRTVLEATWLPADREPPPVASMWDVWAARGGRSQDWVTVRRACKAGGGLLAVLVALALLTSRSHRPHHLIGGLTAVIAGGLLISMTGPVTNLVLLMPALLPLWAANHAETPRVRVAEHIPPPLRLGREPRISVEL